MIFKTEKPKNNYKYFATLRQPVLIWSTIHHH